jgi:hypothetical protein
VLAQIASLHGGDVEDTRSGLRMKGEGAYAESIRRLFTVFRKRYFAGRSVPEMNVDAFTLPPQGQLDLFA